MHDERVSVSSVHDPVSDAGPAVSPSAEGLHGDDGGVRRSADPVGSGVDDTPRDHLNKPAADWQKRPMPWDYKSKAQYKNDLQKFMNEVFGNDGTR